MFDPFSELTLPNTPLPADFEGRHFPLLNHSKKGAPGNLEDLCCLGECQEPQGVKLAGAHAVNVSQGLCQPALILQLAVFRAYSYYRALMLWH